MLFHQTALNLYRKLNSSLKDTCNWTDPEDFVPCGADRTLSRISGDGAMLNHTTGGLNLGSWSAFTRTLFTGDTRGEAWPPEFKTPVCNLEVPVYNSGAKKWILGPLFYIFSKKCPALLHMTWILYFFHILLISLVSSFYYIFHVFMSRLILSVKIEVKYFLCFIRWKNVWELINISM